MDHTRLHALADHHWRTTEPGNTAAARYSDAAHDLLADLPSPHARATKWIRTLHRYEQFWEDQGRTPRENTRARHTLPADERHLGEWARYQRRYEDQLNPYQRARLNVSPAFAWDLRDAGWRRNLAACREHRRRTGQLPRLNSNNPAEFTLARWLGRQLRRLQLGKLDQTQRRQLETLLDPLQHGDDS